MQPTLLAALFEFSRTAFSMSAAVLALLVIGLLAAKNDMAQARGLDKIVALTNLCFAIPLAAGVWNTLSMLAGALVGGYVAARASALRRIADGMLHGTVAWGATTLVFAAIALTSTSGFAGGLFNAIAENGRVGAPAVPRSAGAITAPAPVTADNAARAAAASGWLTVATVLSLLGGLAGGALGARGARRYAARPAPAGRSKARPLRAGPRAFASRHPARSGPAPGDRHSAPARRARSPGSRARRATRSTVRYP